MRAIGCNAPSTNPDATTRNLQNVEDKHTDQPTKKREATYPIHMLPLEQPYFETIYFKKCMYRWDVKRNFIKRIL